MNETISKEVEALLQGCLKDDREAQRKLYKLFYGYAMSICLRYTKETEEARDVLNDGFLKVFTRLKQYDPKKPFKGWLRRIMINTALDNYRHNLKHYYHQDLEASEQEVEQNDALRQIAYEDLIRMIQELSPAYRAVFNLFVIDGYSHEEIADLLGISIGTSKSNLAKARANLREAIKKRSADEYKQYVWRRTG